MRQHCPQCDLDVTEMPSAYRDGQECMECWRRWHVAAYGPDCCDDVAPRALVERLKPLAFGVYLDPSEP